MVREADQFKADDDKIRDSQKSRNELEGLLFGTRGQLEGENKLPISAEDKTAIENKVTELLAWMDGNK